MNNCHHADLICCPVCKCKFEQVGIDSVICTSCQKSFPMVDGIPILINECNSIFSHLDFVQRKDTTFELKKLGIAQTLRRLGPSISKNFKVAENLAKFETLLTQQQIKPRILIIGGSIIGEGATSIYSNKLFELIETDVSFGVRTQVICDAHDIPFESETFDAVIVQAVLEHVVDPFRCVAEIHRVLRADGLVYADTPFMQQVHMGRYDFMRFTHLGHRRLFRSFSEIESGASCGTGMALAWSYRAFLWSFSENKQVARVLGLFASLTSFWLKYFDYFLLEKSGVMDAASGFYFIGKKSSDVLSDVELLKCYRGRQQ